MSPTLAEPCSTVGRRLTAVRDRSTFTGDQVFALRSSIGGDAGNRTRIQGFAGPCLNHSATSPAPHATDAGVERFVSYPRAMQLRIFTEPQQGARYADLLAVARRSEHLGFDGFFRSDHFLKMGNVNGLPGPSDAWTTLAGLARDTSRIRLGTLVNSATFRHPGVLAISVANVDDMSGGRVELGLGAGWFDAEHRAYGIAFPEIRDRFDVLEEQLAVVDGLWRTPHGTTFSYTGRYYSVVESPALPKPIQSPPPIIVGGRGALRTPALAARHAAEFNIAFPAEGEFERQRDRVREACELLGRDPATMTMSVALCIACGASDAEVARRAAAIGRAPAELRASGLCGTPDELVERLALWASRGVQRTYLQVLDLADLEHLDLVASAVAPHLPVR